MQGKALVWRASHGVYALEDASLRDLLAQEGMLRIDFHADDHAGKTTP